MGHFGLQEGSGNEHAAVVKAAGAQVHALHTLSKLGELLDEEFELLKTATFDTLEPLQAQKVALLSTVQELAGGLMAECGGVLPAPVLASAVSCRELHRRNELLLNRKLEVVRGALRAIEFSRNGESAELYDRAGRSTWALGRPRRRT